MKRKLVSIVVMLSLMFGGFYYVYQKIGTVNGLWDLNWGLKVPKPTKITTVFEHSGRDLDAYYVCEYDERVFQKVEKLNLWNKVGNENLDMLSERVSRFKATIEKMHFPESKLYTDLFLRYPIEFDKESLYYLKEKENGNYFIAILNTNKKIMYILEIS